MDTVFKMFEVDNVHMLGTNPRILPYIGLLTHLGCACPVFFVSFLASNEARTKQ